MVMVPPFFSDGLNTLPMAALNCGVTLPGVLPSFVARWQAGTARATTADSATAVTILLFTGYTPSVVAVVCPRPMGDPVSGRCAVIASSDRARRAARRRRG